MYKKIIFIAIAVISIAGCRKDEKNVAPTDQLDNLTYPKTLNDLSSFLTPAYSNFRNANLFGYEYLSLVLCSDHTFCSQNSGGNPFGIQGGDFLTNDIAVTNTPNTAMFSQLYVGVANINVFLERANYYLGSHNDAASISAVNALRGQAYFLRAYYFYLLENFYGEKYIDMTQPEDPNVLGISMPLSFANSVAQTNLPRSSAYRVWTQIINDFKLSAQLLHGVTYAATDKGRITEWAADGMAGKAYVFTKQYDSAKVYLLKVINDGVHSLMPFSQYKDAFNGNSANEFNSESLFEINVDRQVGQGGILFSGNYKQSLTTDEGILFAPTIIGGNGVQSTGNGDGNGGGSSNMGSSYCKFFVHDKNLARFGFNLPVYSYRANPNAVGPNSASEPAFIMDSTTWANSLTVRTDNSVDPRLFVCALEPWVDSVEQPYTRATNPVSQAANYPDTVPVGKAFIIPGSISSPRINYWGWSFKKYATTQDALLAYGNNDASNIYLLRLADVYLLYAEACIALPDGLGTTSDGLEYINKVHRRAYNGSSAFDYATINSPTKDTVAADVDLVNNPLRYERYVELFGEGGWWFDMCRWGIGSTEASYYVYGSAEYNPATQTGPANSLINTANWSSNGTNSKAYHFPIPSTEIQTNTSIQRNNYPY